MVLDLLSILGEVRLSQRLVLPGDLCQEIVYLVNLELDLLQSDVHEKGKLSGGQELACTPLWEG